MGCDSFCGCVGVLQLGAEQYRSILILSRGGVSVAAFRGIGIALFTRALLKRAKSSAPAK